MKTYDLTGAALDWAVAKCEEVEVRRNSSGFLMRVRIIPNQDTPYSPSKRWAQGGPIIEREWLDITPWPNESDGNLRWQCQQHDNIDCLYFGQTPLIAAMRCYVASKLGDEVDVPEELK